MRSDKRRMRLLGNLVAVPDDTRFRVSKKGVSFFVFGNTKRCNHGIELDGLVASDIDDAETRWIVIAACEAAIVNMEQTTCVCQTASFRSLEDGAIWRRILNKVRARQ